jgi:ABC-type multidrug transport system, ATPase component
LNEYVNKNSAETGKPDKKRRNGVRMLEITGLTKVYEKYKAADEVSLTIGNGEIGILLGPNGAGKSTVIKSIAGLLRYQGSIYIKGKEARSIEAKKVFAYVPELPAMYEALTVREHMDFIIHAYHLQTSEAEVQKLLERFELWDKQDKLGSELSKGMMQKVSICCALIIHPDVILLDEPMVGLDPAAIKELKQVVLELKAEGVTVLISTHMLEMVRELWDIMFVMDKGHIVASYRKSEVKEEDLEELFFHVTDAGGGKEGSRPGEEL